jgi:hypothetical protein
LGAVGGFIRFVAFAVVLVALLVFVVVPALASPLLTQMLRDQGLQADNLEVSVDAFDPSLFAGRAEKLRLTADNVVLSPATIGHLDLTLGKVSFVERTFQTISGQLRGVALSAGGLALSVSTVEVDGPAREAQAAGHMNASESEQMVRAAAQRAGIGLDSVLFRDGGLRITSGGVETAARISVQGGALVLDPDSGPAVLLLQPSPPDPWRLTEAYVTPDGITINGVVDTTRLAEQLPGVP